MAQRVELFDRSISRRLRLKVPQPARFRDLWQGGFLAGTITACLPPQAGRRVPYYRFEIANPDGWPNPLVEEYPRSYLRPLPGQQWEWEEASE